MKLRNALAGFRRDLGRVLVWSGESGLLALVTIAAIQGDSKQENPLLGEPFS